MDAPELQKFSRSPAIPHNLRCCRRRPSPRHLLRTAASGPSAGSSFTWSEQRHLASSHTQLRDGSSPAADLLAASVALERHAKAPGLWTPELPGPHPQSPPGSARPPRPLWLRRPKPTVAPEHPHTSRPAPFKGSPGIISSAAGSCPDRPLNAAAICKPQLTFSAPLLITVSTTWDSFVYGLTPPAPSFLLEYELHGGKNHLILHSYNPEV